MRTKPKNPDLATRKAFIWQDEAPPRLADLMTGGAARQRFLRYWVWETLKDVPKLASYYGLKFLPVGAASALGAFYYDVIRRFYPGRNARLAANSARIRPDLEPQAIPRANWRNKGRLMAEFSGLRRIEPAGRIRAEGGEALQAAYAQGPIVLLCLHLGNWELLLPVLRRLDIKVAAFYMPPESRAEHRIAYRARQGFGAALLAPGISGVRQAMKRLAQPGGAVVIFGDEGFHGRIMAPFFGRPPHLAGNLAIAVRLARHAGAQIVPCYLERQDGARFVCRILPPVALDTAKDPAAALAADVARLNAVIEPIVRQHIDQWYFLDHRL